VFGRAQIGCVSRCAHNRLGPGNSSVFFGRQNLYGTAGGDGMSGRALAGTNLPAESQQKDDRQDDHPVENTQCGHERVSLGEASPILPQWNASCGLMVGGGSKRLPRGVVDSDMTMV